MTNILVVFAFICLYMNCDAVILKTKQGNLKGLVLESRNGTKYNAFMGIPFAKPPVGELRFESPQPPNSWTDVRDATKPASRCAQLTVMFSDIMGPDIGLEDCLYANIYSPSRPRAKSKIPVMVWIHGGGFLMGGGDSYEPRYFMDHDIIIVTFNYRVGALGFLSAADEFLPGNYGLKDQIAVLKWVQTYIDDFGGDPQRVTIAGMSAGGASVHLLMHSSLSQGLFQAAISHSGSALASWAQIPPAVARQKFNAFGILAGCSTESTPVLVDCLRNVSTKEILKIQKKFYVRSMIPVNVFSLVKEHANVKNAFLREDPWHQRVQMDVPYISSFTSSEGATFAAMALVDEGKQFNELAADYKQLFPLIFSYRYWFKNKDVERITESLRQFYFGDKKIGFETIHEMIKLFSDGFFNYDIMEGVYRHTNKVFMLFYDYKGAKRFQNIFVNISIDLGVAHGDDFFSFFPNKNTTQLPNLTSKDLEVSERLVKYWVNFAYTGKPTSDNSWLPSESEKELTYLHVHNDRFNLKTGLLQDRYSFWKGLEFHPSLARNLVVSNCQLLAGALASIYLAFVR